MRLSAWLGHTRLVLLLGQPLWRQNEQSKHTDSSRLPRFTNSVEADEWEKFVNNLTALWYKRKNKRIRFNYLNHGLQN
ncbi:hypothetical protein RRG08_011864 [Elysia crispata]|uniref:Uncharacterized protein n=1 Tax=Elysia crispata TaxID=231223 RepID=A0AAE0ZN62_9GAST|nr:hypothetical protein RRG08_011864 [Elysia crispata]